MANGGQIRYTVGFDVDKSGLSQIKTSLQELKALTAQDLMRMDGRSLERAKMDIDKIHTSVKQLDGAFEKAFNVNLGTLNISKFNQELQKINLNKIYADLSKAGTAGQAAFRNIATQALTTNMQLKQTNTLLNSMATTMANTIKWGISSSVMNTFTRSVQQAYGYVKSLDGSLNDIRIVTQKSAEEMDKFAVKANNAAKALGQSTTNYTDAALIYYQQGLSDEEVAARAEVTLKAANVTGQSGEAVSEQLTAVWNGYKVSAEEAELYIDKLAAVAATTASDLEELSTGMSKVASAANLMGVDIDQLNAQLATIVSVTRQAPESVGTALKTIYARMGDIEAGLDSETTLGHYTEAMAEMGFNVLDAQGNLRDMGAVIEEIGGKWQTLSREQQIALSQTMAGTRQYNNLLSLFDNWDMYTEAMETSANAAGTLQQQQDTYMESTAAHLKTMKASAEDLYDSLLDADTINGFAGGMTKVLDLLSNFVDSIGGGGGVLLALGAIGTKVFSQQIATGLATTIANSQIADENIKKLNAEMEILAQFDNAKIGDSNTQQLIAMKQQQLDLTKALTAEERQVSNEYIVQQNNLYQQQDELNNRLQQASELYTQLTGTTVDTRSDTARTHLADSLEQTARDLRGYIENVNEAKIAMSDFKRAQKDLKEGSESYNATLKHSNETIQTHVDKAQELVDLGILEGKQKKQLQASIDRYNLALEASSNEGLKNVSVQIAAREVVETYKSVNDELIQSIGKAEQDTRSYTGAIQSNTYAIQQNAAGHNQMLSNVSLRQQIMDSLTLVGSLGQVASAISSIGRIPKIINNDDLTTGEKLLQLTTSLGFAVPMLIKGFTKLSDSVKTYTVSQKINNTVQEIENRYRAEEIALGQAQIPQKEKDIGLTNLQTQKEVELAAARKISNATMKESIALMLANPFVAVALAIGACAAAMYVGIKAANAHRDATKKAVEEAQRQTEIYNQVKSSYDNLKSSIEDYQESKKAIDELTKGTQDWRDAINDANQKVLELLQNFPELANWIENVDGQLVIGEEGLEAIRELQSQRVETAFAASNEASAQAEESKINENTVDVQRRLSPGGVNSTGFSEESVTDILKTINEKGSGFLYAKDEETAKSQIDKMFEGNNQINDNIVNAIYQNRDWLVKVAGENRTSEKAAESYRDMALETELQNQEGYSELSKNLQEVVKNEYKDAREEKANKLLETDAYRTMTKDDIHDDYAKLRGAKYDTETKKYKIGDEEFEVDDEQAKFELALDEAADSLSNFSKEVSKDIDSLPGTDDIKEVFKSTYDGQIGDLSNLSNNQLQDLSMLGQEDFTEDQAINMGFDNVALLLLAIEKAVLEENQKRENEINSFETEASNYIDENFTEDQASQIKNSMKNLDTSFVEDAINQGVDLEEIISNIDWMSIPTDAPSNWLEEAYKESLKKASKEEAISEIQSEGAQLGFDEDQIAATKEYTESLLELAEAGEEVHNNLSDYPKLAKEIAKEDTRIKKGVDDLRDSWDDYSKALKEGPTSSNYLKSLTELKDNLEDILDVTEADPGWLTDEFISNNMDDIKAAAEGSGEAIDRLRLAAAEEIITKAEVYMDPENEAQFYEQFGNIKNMLDDVANEDLKVGASIDDSQYAQQLYQMMQDAGYTSEQIANAFNEIGWEPEIETRTYTLSEDDVKNGFVKVPGTIDPETGEVTMQTIPVSSSAKADTTMSYTVIKGKGKGSSFKPTMVRKPSASVSGSSSGKSGGGGGGGGGGSKAKAKDPLETKKDRYHDVNIELKHIENELDKIEKDQEKLFGQDLIDSLNEELELLEKQKEALYEKLRIAKEERAELQEKLRLQGVEFDPETNDISNYLSLIEQKEAELQAMIDHYNTLSGDAQSDYEENVLGPAQEAYEELLELMGRYDELNSEELAGLEEEIQDIIDKEIEINVKKFNVEVDIALDLRDAKKEWESFKRKYLDKIDEDDILGNALADRNLYEDLIGGPELEILPEKINKTIEEINKINNGELGDIYGDDKNAALEELRNYQSELMASMEEIYETQKKLDEAYMEAADQRIEASEKEMELLQQMNDMLEHSMTLIDMLYGEDSYQEKAALFEAQRLNDLAKMASLRARADDYATRMNDESLSEEEREKWKEAWLETIGELNSEVENGLQRIIDQYVNAVNAAFKEIEDKITNGLGFDYLQEQWDLTTQNADMYLDTINKAYEIQSLENKINQSIDSAASTKAQRELNKLKDEELKKLREKEKLTQYDVDRANALYELKLKEIALEEAQKNKSQMRLRRDASGNYSYQFVADSDGIAQAQQEVDEAKNSLYNLDRDALRENQEAVLQMLQEYNEKRKEIEADTTLSEEQKNAKLLLINQQYNEMIGQLLYDNNDIRENLEQSYLANVENYHLDTVNNQIVPIWSEGMQAVIDMVRGEGGLEGVYATAAANMSVATEEYNSALQELQETAGVTFETLSEGYNENIALVNEFTEQQREVIAATIEELEAVEDLRAEVDNLALSWKAVEDNAIAAMVATQEALEAEAEAELERQRREQEQQNGENSEGGGSEGGSGGSESGSGGSGGSGGTSELTNEIIDGIAGSIWYWSPSAWGRGKERKQKIESKFGSGAYEKVQGYINEHVRTNGTMIKPFNYGYADRDKYKEFYYSKFDTGGYTGDWAGNDGRTAILHKKELVLNQRDTKNMLAAVSMVRGMEDLLSSLNDSILTRITGMTSGLGSDSQLKSELDNNQLEQIVHITADFPNVSSSHEIEDAFNNLINVASQYAFNNKR